MTLVRIKHSESTLFVFVCMYYVHCYCSERNCSIVIFGTVLYPLSLLYCVYYTFLKIVGQFCPTNVTPHHPISLLTHHNNTPHHPISLLTHSQYHPSPSHLPTHTLTVMPVTIPCPLPHVDMHLSLSNFSILHTYKMSIHTDPIVKH